MKILGYAVSAAVCLFTTESQAQLATCKLASPGAAVVDDSETQRLENGCAYTVRIPDAYWASRSFKLWIPDSFWEQKDRPRMVLDFHGYLASAQGQFNTSCWRDRAAEDGFVVAYPNASGLPRAYDAGDYCCGVSIDYPVDDVQFARDVVATVRSALATANDPVTPTNPVVTATWKAYASGLSNGGALAHRLACDANDVFSGIAPVSQTFPYEDVDTCLGPGETPIPVIDFRGVRDRTIPYDGGYSATTFFRQDWLSAEESRDAWATALECSGEAPSVHYQDGSYCLRMTNCSADFVQCTVNGPHVLYSSATEDGIDICKAAWKFFGESTRPPSQDPTLP